MTEQLKLALEAYTVSRGPGAYRDTLLNHARVLGEAGGFSRRQIANIVGLQPYDLRDAVKKSDRAGGRLAPESLPLLAGMMEMYAAGDEAETRRLLHEAYTLGTSLGTISRLTGESESWARHRLEARQREIAAEREGSDE